VLRQILPEDNPAKIHTKAQVYAQRDPNKPVFAREISLFNYHPGGRGNDRNLYRRYKNN
jgi:hypothetical protein